MSVFSSWPYFSPKVWNIGNPNTAAPQHDSPKTGSTSKSIVYLTCCLWIFVIAYLICCLWGVLQLFISYAFFGIL